MTKARRSTSALSTSWRRCSGRSTSATSSCTPLNDGSTTYARTKPVARGIAELLEAQTPDRVVSRMARALRPGKVLVDWSQNTEHKSMVCVYSVRAKQRPTVSTPVCWAEIEAAVGAGDPELLVFDIDAVLARVERHGDLFSEVLTLRQQPDVQLSPQLQV